MKLKFLDSLRSANSKTAATDRRSFLFKLGVGASATLASTASFAGVAKDKDDAATRLAKLEDEQQLRQLHQRYEKLIDAGRYDEVLELFTDKASVIFNGGVFNTKHQGLSRLYREHFAANKTGTTMRPAPGFELAADQQQEVLEVAADRQTAKAVFPYSIQVGMPLESVTSHAAMARLHGEGVRTWWEGGVYELSYVKAKDGRWLIGRLEYNTLSRADYREGRTHAEPIEVARFSKVYPEAKCGPDRLV